MQTFPNAAKRTKVRCTLPHNGDMWVVCGLLEQAATECTIDRGAEALTTGLRANEAQQSDVGWQWTIC